MVTDVEVASGDELLNRIDRRETVVDNCGDLFEMPVECSDSEGDEQGLDIDPGEDGGGVPQWVDEGLREIGSFRA